MNMNRHSIILVTPEKCKQVLPNRLNAVKDFAVNGCRTRGEASVWTRGSKSLTNESLTMKGSDAVHTVAFNHA
jgi:hypothetical protein